MPDMYGTNGQLLFTHEQLHAKLNPRRSANRRSLPDWMHALTWPPGMVDAMRAARQRGDRAALASMFREGQMLLQAEDKGLTVAAAAIRNELTTKYRRET